eukprot:3994029-Amphidinium_carterae.2
MPSHGARGYSCDSGWVLALALGRRQVSVLPELLELAASLAGPSGSTTCSSAVLIRLRSSAVPSPASGSPSMGSALGISSLTPCIGEPSEGVGACTTGAAGKFCSNCWRIGPRPAAGLSLEG